MMFSATKDGRLAEAVVLEVDLDVVSLPGVLFADRNAAASEAVVSSSPEVVLCRDQFAVSSSDRPFYQAEVLVPANVPPHFIHFPSFAASGLAPPCPCCCWPCSCSSCRSCSCSCAARHSSRSRCRVPWPWLCCLGPLALFEGIE